MVKPSSPAIRIKTPYVGVYYRYAKRRKCADGKLDKCYDITFKRPGGKTVYERVGWRSEGYTIEDAIRLRGLRVRENRHPELFKPSRKSERPKDITVDEAWDAFKRNWLPNLKNQYQTERTYKCYIRPRFGQRYILSISELELEGFKQELLTTGGKEGNGLKPASVAQILTNFKRIVNKALKWNLVEGKNPLSGMTVKNAFEKRERYLSREEADKIFDGLQFFSCSLYRISRIALYTGMRLNEIISLKGHDINLEQGTIHIRFGKAGERTAYIPKDFTAELAKMLPSEPTDLLFTRSTGEPLSAAATSLAFAKFIDSTGLNKPGVDACHKIVFHTFRHTFCSWLAIAGVPLYTIAKLAGHKTISMTQRYAKLSPNVQRDALDHLT